MPQRNTVRHFTESGIYHVYNRGVEKRDIFLDEQDYAVFLHLLKYYLSPIDPNETHPLLNFQNFSIVRPRPLANVGNEVELIEYCLMPNHFHFLFYAPVEFDSNKFSNSLKTLLSSYTRAINIQNKTSGSLFQQHSRMKCLSYESKKETDYGRICFNYIHQNPYVAGLVNRIEDWEYSSFKDYVGLRNGTLCNKEFALEKLELPLNIKELYNISYININKKQIGTIL